MAEMSAFQINAKIEELQDKDLDPQVLVDTIESLELTRNEKLDGAAGLIDRSDMKIALAKRKAKEWQEVARVEENKKKRLNQYVTEVIDGAGIKELVTKEHIFKPRNFKDSVVVDKLADLPKEYITYIEDVKADKKKLYADLKAGTEINGAHLKANRGTTIK